MLIINFFIDSGSVILLTYYGIELSVLVQFWYFINYALRPYDILKFSKSIKCLSENTIFDTFCSVTIGSNTCLWGIDPKNEWDMLCLCVLQKIFVLLYIYVLFNTIYNIIYNNHTSSFYKVWFHKHEKKLTANGDT